MSDDVVLALASALAESRRTVLDIVKGLDAVESQRATEFVISAYDLAVEMWYQKGDAGAPHFTNWERPWRKYGGDNPTTTYLSAPVDPEHVYRIHGNIGDAVYAGVQVYTRGAGYNAPSGNISDQNLVSADGNIDLTVGGEQPTDGSPWLPLIKDDYLVMLRLYHRKPEYQTPDMSIERVDTALMPALSADERAHRAAEFFHDEILSTIAVTDTLRAAGVNAYPPADAPVHRPRYTGALFPTLDNIYDGFYVKLNPGQELRIRGTVPTARYVSFVFYDRWFNTPDFAVNRCYRTLAEVELSADGTYELVLGPENPDHPNWLDTGGLREGIFSIRYLLPQERVLPEVKVVTR